MDEIQGTMKLLGVKGRDRVTGFVGVISSVSFDLYGCIQAVLSPSVDDKGELKDGRWFDVSRIEVTNATPVMELPAWMPHEPKAQASAVRGPASKPAMPSNGVR